VSFTVLKPKRKRRKNRRRNKKNNKENPSGPKPSTSLISVAARAKPERHEQRSFQVGESSEVGTVCDAVGLGLRPPLLSILGKFKWVRKVGQSDVEEAELVTSPLEVCELGLGLGFAAQGVYEVGSSSQTASTMESGHFD
jgi:hypothetical protein